MNTLKQGSKGGDVKLLQKYMGVTQDGIWGPKTTEAVKKWQTSNGLVADGIVGPKTWLKLIENDLKSGQLTDADYIKAAVELDVEVAALKAIKEVESGGKAFVNGIPIMLFEGHIFWNQLKMRGIDPNKYVKGNEDILYPKWTKSHYTGKNSGELARLQKAIAINEAAAYESASYGMFQIMGNNYKVCGYNSAKEFYQALCKSEDAHFYSFIKFIKAKGIVPYLKARKWDQVAYRYNGSGYKANKYDTKLAAAYNKFK